MTADLLMKRGAELSQCCKYRYMLYRTWNPEKARLSFVMLNPSTADSETDDATIRVCMGRAQRMGFGGIRITNLFHFRATKPEDLFKADDPIGNHPFYDNWYAWACSYPVEMVIAAWGHHGTYRDRDRQVISMISMDYGKPLYALRLTKDGHPCHPLRIPYSTEPFLWKELR